MRYLLSGRLKRALVVSADGFSRLLDRTNPAGLIFGDGAGAAVIERLPQGYGFIHSVSESDSTHYELAGVRWAHPNEGNNIFKPFFYVDGGRRMAYFVPKLVPG
ncbi:MAG: hypothetical protein HY099_01205 [Nitrospirae bacterium]|nr:hypothetical protein [Nitrospirota bacterium]